MEVDGWRVLFFSFSISHAMTDLIIGSILIIFLSFFFLFILYISPSFLFPSSQIHVFCRVLRVDPTRIVEQEKKIIDAKRYHCCLGESRGRRGGRRGGGG